VLPYDLQHMIAVRTRLLHKIVSVSASIFYSLA